MFTKDLYPVLIARRGREGGRGGRARRNPKEWPPSCIFYDKKNPQSGVSNKNSRIK